MVVSAGCAARVAWLLSRSVSVPHGIKAESMKLMVKSLAWKDISRIWFWIRMTLIFYDLYRQNPADNHSYFSLVKQHLMFKLNRLFSWWFNRRFTKNCKTTKTKQDTLLLEILNHARETSYAKQTGLDKIHTTQSFCQLPLTSYKDYESYITRVISGEQNVLFPENVDFIATTSGTVSGKSKMFPKNRSLMSKHMVDNYSLALCNIRKLPRTTELKFKVDVRWTPAYSKTEKGVRIGPVTGLYSSITKKYDQFNTSPEVISGLEDMNSAIYLHLVFAVREPDVSTLYFHMPAVGLLFFSMMEERWEDLCLDIETGTINHGIKIPDAIRQRLNKELGANRKVADRLRQEFHKGFKNIAERLWPGCGQCIMLASGGFQTQAELIKRKYLGEIPVNSVFHTSTEGCWGVNMNPGKIESTYVLLPGSAFYEFIPEDGREDEHPETLLTQQVKVGQSYELVVTTWEGLYRYRTNDIIKIVDFFHQSPVYEFIQRSTDVLNIYAEKTPEFVISEALMSVVSKHSEIDINNYTFTENVNIQNLQDYSSTELHYIIFIEIEGTGLINPDVTTKVDEKLRSLSTTYDLFRNNDRLTQLRFIQLKPGTFTKLKQVILAGNPHASELQCKIPRITRQEDQLTCVMAGRID